MGCNPSKHTTVQDTPDTNCNGSTTTEKADDELDVKCGAEAAAESSEAPEWSNTLCPATEPTPADDPEAGAPAAGQTERTESEEAPDF